MWLYNEPSTVCWQRHQLINTQQNLLILQQKVPYERVTTVLFSIAKSKRNTWPFKAIQAVPYDCSYHFPLHSTSHSTTCQPHNALPP